MFKFSLILISSLILSAGAYAGTNDLPASPAEDISIDGNVIYWGNGFTTSFNSNSMVTKDSNGNVITVKNGKLICIKVNKDTSSCEQYTAYNSGLVEDMLTRILPAAGGEETSPESSSNQPSPETNVLLNGDIPTIPPILNVPAPTPVVEPTFTTPTTTAPS